jgi:hypothetical protein
MNEIVLHGNRTVGDKRRESERPLFAARAGVITADAEGNEFRRTTKRDVQKPLD